MNTINKKLFLVITFFILVVLQSCYAEIDPTVSNTLFGLSAIKYEFIITLISLCSGILCLIGGFILIILGFAGSIDWIVEVSGFSSKLINASPGIILLIVGLIIVLNSRIKVKNRQV